MSKTLVLLSQPHGATMPHLTWALPLVPFTVSVLESWELMLQVKLPWTPPGHSRITVTVSSTPAGQSQGRLGFWVQIAQASNSGCATLPKPLEAHWL